MLDKVKAALRLTVSAYDDELTDLIAAAKQDLSIADVLTDEPDELVQRAIITYCRLNFGGMTDGEYARLKASYDEQKGQLQLSSHYSGRGDEE